MQTYCILSGHSEAQAIFLFMKKRPTVASPTVANYLYFSDIWHQDVTILFSLFR